MKTSNKVIYTVITREKDTNVLIADDKTVLIPEKIGDYALNGDKIARACEYLIFADIETKVNKLQLAVDNYKDSKNFERAEYDKKVKKLNEIIDLRDGYIAETGIDKFDADSLNNIDWLFGFMITEKSVYFEGGYSITKKVLEYYKKYFDIDDNHTAEKSALKKDIMTFVNNRLTETTFKIDKINDETLKHIVSTACKRAKMTDKGVKSIDITINAKTVEKYENAIIHQIFMATIGVKTGYVEKVKKSPYKYGISL